MFNAVKNNIFICYIYNILIFFNLSRAIWVLYLSFRGLTLFEIGIAEAVFHITSLLCEIPTGAVADIYGRKFTIVLGRVMAAISAVLMINGNDIFVFSVAFMISALSYNLHSGLGEALLYDSLKQLDREIEYKKIIGSIFFYAEIGQGLAVIIGGTLADKNYFYVYAAVFAIELFNLFIALHFTETAAAATSNQRKITFSSQIVTAVQVVWQRKLVTYYMLFFNMLSAFDTTIYFYCQKYFSDMSFSQTTIAFIFVASNAVNAIGANIADKVERKLKVKGTLWLIALLQFTAFTGIGMAGKNCSVPFFLLSTFLQSMTYPISSDYINSLIPSEYRATLISMESVFFSVFMIAFFPLVGFWGEKIGLSQAFLLIALLSLPCVVCLILKIEKNR